MEKFSINEWSYPYETLPHWDMRKEKSGICDALIESPSGKYACLLYSIEELDNTYFKLVAKKKEMKSFTNLTWVDGAMIKLEEKIWFPIKKLNNFSKELKKLKKATWQK